MEFESLIDKLVDSFFALSDLLVDRDSLSLVLCDVDSFIKSLCSSETEINLELSFAYLSCLSSKSLIEKNLDPLTVVPFICSSKEA